MYNNFVIIRMQAHVPDPLQAKIIMAKARYSSSSTIYPPRIRPRSIIPFGYWRNSAPTLGCHMLAGLKAVCGNCGQETTACSIVST